jgi:acid phosphatase (class A)
MFIRRRMSSWVFPIAMACATAPVVQAQAQAVPAPEARAETSPARPPPSPPYISGDVTGLLAVLPPAPQDGDARDQADRRIFRETRALAGTPRWEMAAGDAELGSGALLRHFSCSLGVEMEASEVPRLVALLQKATREAARTVGTAKEHFRRPRPFIVQEGATCVPATSVGESFDYPSGHATAGWAWGLVLAQVDPPHAVPLLARGRAIGDSRVVCGMHNVSAVEGARMITGAAISLVAASELFQSDLAAARAELAAVRAGPHVKPDPARCAQEQELAKAYW